MRVIGILMGLLVLAWSLWWTAGYIWRRSRASVGRRRL